MPTDTERLNYILDHFYLLDNGPKGYVVHTPRHNNDEFREQIDGVMEPDTTEGANATD